MQMESLASWRPLLAKSIEGSIEKSEYLNLPDLQFFTWCNQQYGLNKGVYNTIDNWFYEYGVVNILYRRIYLLAFLDYSKDTGVKQDHHKFLRFGNGGLIKKLQEFMVVYRKESLGRR